MLAQYHGRSNVLTQPAMGYCKGHSFRHRRMAEEHAVDFLRRNFFPTAINDLLDTAGEEQVAIGIQIPSISRPEPAMRESAPVCHEVVFIALHDSCASHHDLTDDTHWQQGACL